MKILMTADTVGGVWTYALELALGLSEYDIHVALATMGAHPTSEQCDQVRQMDNVTLHTSEYKLEWMDDPWDDVALAGKWLMHLQNKIKPDIVHLNGYAHGSLDWQSPVVMVAHSCVLSWWDAVKHEPAPGYWGRYRQEVAQGLRSADLVMAPTNTMLNAIIDHYGPLDTTCVVPNGRDVEAFWPDIKEPFVFSAGRLWDEAKNIALLENVAPNLSWPVCIAGEDHSEDAVVPNVRRLGRLAPQVLPLWYGRASIYAMPARYEPFGLSALEAALSGCALVLGDIPSLREVWGDAAIFVPPDDDVALETAITALIDDGFRLADMASRACARGSEYTTERMTQSYLAAIHHRTTTRTTTIV